MSSAAGKEKLMVIKEPADLPHEGCSPQLCILVKHICNSITVIVAIATFFSTAIACAPVAA
jgi:hypothetical protein